MTELVAYAFVAGHCLLAGVIVVTAGYVLCKGGE